MNHICVYICRLSNQGQRKLPVLSLSKELSMPSAARSRTLCVQMYYIFLKYQQFSSEILHFHSYFLYFYDLHHSFFSLFDIISERAMQVRNKDMPNHPRFTGEAWVIGLISC